MGRMVVVNVSVQKMGRRGVCGIEARTETLALGMFSQTGLHGDFLKLKETRALFRCEQHFASTIIDRRSRGKNYDEMLNDTFFRARQRVRELRSSYLPAVLSAETRSRLLGIAARETRLVGLAGLPGIEQTAPILGI